MPRIDLPEIEDQHWFPKSLRNMLTDYLQFMYARTGIFLPIVPLLKRALADTGAERFVDLCSGGGGPVPYLQRRLAEEGIEVGATLTDKFPNLDAFRAMRAAPGSRITFVEHSVDASAVPDDLAGFRTLFTGLHHLPPDLAQKILADAVRGRQGIGIFEVNERAPMALFFTLLVPFAVLLATPFIRPFTWQRLVFTYLLPVIPLVTMWDGFASNMRTYSRRELERLTASISDDGQYQWEIGRIPAGGGWNITYVLGLPMTHAATAEVARAA